MSGRREPALRPASNLVKADVDVLAAAGLLAVDGEGVGSLLKRRLHAGGDGGGAVVGSEAAEGVDELAVDVDLGVFVVMDSEAELIDVGGRELEGAAEPDVFGVPLGADHGRGSAFGSEAAGALFPVSVFKP